MKMIKNMSPFLLLNKAFKLIVNIARSPKPYAEPSKSHDQTNNAKQRFKTYSLMCVAVWLMAIQAPAFAIPNPIITTPASPTNSTVFSVNIQFSESVAGTFDISDIAVNNGLAENFVTTDGKNYSVDIKPATEGIVTISIPIGVAQNSFGDDNTAISTTITYDITPATPVISTTLSNPTHTNPITVQIDFGENTLGFLANDVVVTNGLIGGFVNVDGAKYTLQITPSNPSGEIPLTIEIPANIAKDIAGNDNQASTPFNIQYDAILPDPVISTAENNPTANSLITYSLNFGEVVTGLSATDFVVTNGTASNLLSADNQTYTLDITANNEGQIAITLPANSAQDVAANGNPEKQFSIVYSTSTPIPVISSTQSPASNTSPISVNIDFGSVVQGFELSDIVIENGTASSALSPAGNSQTYSFDITPTAEGNVTVDIAAATVQSLSSIDNGAASTFTIKYDTTPPTPVISTTEPNPTANESFIVNIDFGEDVTNFGLQDISVSALELGGLSNFTAQGNGLYTVTYTATVNGNIEFSVLANKARDLAEQDNLVSNTLSVITDFPITITGTAYSDEGITAMGAGKTVSLLINGTKYPTSVVTDASGRYEFSQVAVDANDMLTIFLDSNAERGVNVFKTSDKHHSAISLYDGFFLIDSGSIESSELIAAAGSNAEVARVYSGTGNNIEVIANTQIRINQFARVSFTGDVNSNKSANMTLDVDGILSLVNQTSTVYITGDLEAVNSGDLRGVNNNPYFGSILSNTSGTHIVMGMDEANPLQVIYGDNSLNYVEFGPSSTSHTLCFEKDKTTEMEHLIISGADPIKHLIRTCDASGNILNDGSQSSIKPTVTRNVKDVDYRDNRNISDSPIDPINSVNSGNNLGWDAATISGFVWDDSNNSDGIKDIGELGVAGKEVIIYGDNNNDQIFNWDDPKINISSITAADGSYQLSVPSGAYFIVVKDMSDKLLTNAREGYYVNAVSGASESVNFGYEGCRLRVDTAADDIAGDGKVSFREAALCASSGDTIEFDASLNGQSIMIDKHTAYRPPTISFVNKNININTTNTQNITLQASTLGNGVGNPSQFQQAIKIDNSNVSIKGLTINGGRSVVVSTLDVTGSSQIILDDVILTEGLSRFNVNISFKDTSSLVMRGGKITEFNGRASVLHFLSSGDLTLDGVSIYNNSPSNNGGSSEPAIKYAGSGNLHILNSTFNNNRPRKTGAGAALQILATGDPATTITEIVNSTFYNNYNASKGGALYINPTTAINVVISHSTFTDNNANDVGGSGGAIYLENGTATVTLNQTVVSGNKANNITDTIDSDIGGNLAGYTFNKTIINAELRDGATVTPVTKPEFQAFTTYSSSLNVLPPTAQSSLIDQGGTTSLALSAATADQDGTARKLGDAIDVGAIEFKGSSEIKRISGSATTQNHKLNAVIDVHVEFYSAIEYAANGGTASIQLDIGGVTKTALIDQAKTTSAPANTLIFSYIAETNLQDTDGIDVIVNSLGLMGGATLKGPGGFVDAIIAHNAQNLPNDHVDTNPPLIIFDQNVETGPVVSDVVSVLITDTQPNTASYLRGFSADATCDASDTYNIAVVSGTPFAFNTEENSNQYICIKAQDLAGNISYAASANPLNIDLTAPVAVISSSEPFRTAVTPVPFTIIFNEPVKGLTIDDLKISGGTKQSFTGVDGDTVFTVVVEPDKDGLITVNLPANAASDNAGIGNEPVTIFRVSDTLPPQPIFSTTATNPSNTAPIPVTIDFGEVVNGFSISDIVVGGNASIDNFTSIGNRFFNININPISDGDITLDIAADVGIDSVGIGNLVATQFSINYDTQRPTVVISSSQNGRTNIQPIPLTITFDDLINGLNENEIVTTNGSIANLVKTGANTYTAELTAAAEGIVSVQIPASVAIDDANNANMISNRFKIEFDSIGPKPLISSISSNPTATNPIPVSVDFAEAVTGFDATDLVIGNGTLVAGSFSGNQGDAIYSFSVAANGNGVITVDIAAAVASDMLGNANQLADQFSINYDTVGPTPIISSTTPSPTSALFVVTIDFGENISGFTESDLNISNGSVTAGSLAGGSQIYTAQITPSNDGVISIDIAANSVIDAVSNPNLSATQFTITYDSTLPTPIITSTENSPTKNSAIPISIDFQESVVNFSEADMVVGNGAIQLGSLAGGPQIYSAILAPASDGVVTIDIATGAAQDGSNNNSTAAAQFSINADTIKPTPTITTSETKNPTNASVIPLTITFDEAVNGFTLTDIAVSNGVLTDLQTTDNIIFTLSLTPSNEGIVSVDIAATIANDLADNTNNAATQFTITYDSIGSQPVISSTITGPTNISPIPVVIDFSEVVNGFSLTDILVNNGSLGSLKDIGNGQYSVDIIPQDGTVTVDVPVDATTEASGNSNAAALQFTIVYDGSRPTPVITTSLGNPTATSPIPVSINFAEAINGFTLADTVVNNGAISNLVDQGNGTYSATLTPATTGDVTLDIAADIAQDMVGNKNNAAIQFSINYDTSTPIPVLSSTQTSPTGTSPIPLTIDFGENDMTGFTESDIQVSNGAIQAGSLSAGPKLFTAILVPTAEGEVSVDIASGVATNAANTKNQAAATFTMMYDLTPPTPVITSSATSPGTLSPIPVVIDFAEDVTGFALSDIQVGNGTAADFSKISSSLYSVNITPVTGGKVTVDIAAGVAQDAVLIANLAATQYAYDYDTASLSIADLSINEDAGTATVTVTLTGVSTAGTTVDYTITNGLAIKGKDFTATNGTLTFAGTEGETKTFDIAITDDNLLEQVEDLTVTLSNVSNTLVTLTHTTAKVTIIDNDAATISVAATDASASEVGDVGEFTISLSNENATGAPITINFALSGSADEINDYSFIGNNVIIPVGGSRATVAINPVDDTIFDGTETVIMTLTTTSDPHTSIAAAPNNTASVSITDNEEAIGPGGVALNVMLWLKADQGITEAGGAVNSWLDQSGNGTVLSVPATTVFGQPTAKPTWADNLVNFNPSIRFDQANGPAYLSTSNVTIGNNKPYTKVVVFKRNSDATNMALVASDGNPFNGDPIHGFYFPASSKDIAGWHGANTGGGQNVIRTATASQNLSEYTLAILRYDHTGTLSNVLRINGNEEASNNTIVPFNDIGTQIGADQHVSQLDGEISEVVIFGEALSQEKMQVIESYLALKYGLTLGQGTAVNYQNNAGNVFWDAAVAGTFTNNVFGIGRDDKSRLGQVKSTSLNSDAIIILEADNEGTNASPVYADLDDLEYLMLSNQSGNAAWTGTDAPSSFQILQRVWKIQHTGNVGAVKLGFAVNDPTFDVPDLLDGTAYYLIIDSNRDGSFADETPLALTKVAGLQSKVVDLADGQTFTLATEVNNTPVITSTATTTATEDIAYSYAPVATDADAGDTQAWSIVGEPAGMNIDNATGAVSWTPTEGVSSSGAVTITITDSGGLTATETFTIAVTAVNDIKPVLADSTGAIEENSPTDSVVGRVNITNSGDSAITTITLTGIGAENFSVDSNGRITVKAGATLDFETTPLYNLSAIATNAAGDSNHVVVVITVTNQIELSTLSITALSSSTITENQAYTSATPTVSGAIGAITYSLQGTDAALFILNPATGVISMVAQDFEAPADAGANNGYEVSLTASDADGNSATKAITVTVSDIDDTPPTLAIDVNLMGDNLINDSEKTAVVISGSSDAEDGQVVSLAVGSVTATATVANGKWSVTLDLSNEADGAVMIRAEVTDAANNMAQTTGSITKNTTVSTTPANPELTPTNGLIGNSIKVLTSTCGTEYANGKVIFTSLPTGQLVNEPVTVDLDAYGNFPAITLDTSHAKGEFSISMHCSDNAGNPSAEITAGGPYIYAEGDDDHDGIINKNEVNNDYPNSPALDIDGDGIPDFLEHNTHDLDGDGIPNADDNDDDGDGIPTADEKDNDADGDGIPDHEDADTPTQSTAGDSGDSDHDGLPDNQECTRYPCSDRDGDGVPNYMDTDSDNDGISDKDEIGNDPANPTDSDGDGIADYLENNLLDTDGDGHLDYLDNDDDGDGTPTANEIGNDATHPIDTDGDGIPDYLDADTNMNTPMGNPNGDTDQDGIPDSEEYGNAGIAADTDGDGIPNYRDTDDDNDGIGTKTEGATADDDKDGIPNYLERNDLDTDNDGLANHQDADDDNDGIATADERGNDPLNPSPNHLSANSNGQAVIETTLTGGAGGSTGIGWLALLGLLTLLRRRFLRKNKC